MSVVPRVFDHRPGGVGQFLSETLTGVPSLTEPLGTGLKLFPTLQAFLPPLEKKLQDRAELGVDALHVCLQFCDLSSELEQGFFEFRDLNGEHLCFVDYHLFFLDGLGPTVCVRDNNS